MRIGITTASGNLGSHIARATAKRVGSEHVIALARTPEKAAHLGLETRRCDYTDRSGMTESLRGIDSLLVVSSNATPDERPAQHANVFGAAKDAGVRRVVYTSILGESKGSGFSPVVASNRQTEQDLAASGLDWPNVQARSGAL